MWDSLESARFWNSISNWFLFGGAGVTAVALVVNILTAGIKEKYVDLEIAKANQKTEEERLERTHLEAELAPRTIEQRESAKELSRFKDIKVIIESLAESEPWRTAGQVAYLLNNAKWDVLPGMKRFIDATPFFDGISAETNVGAMPKNDHSGEAADALVAVLKKNNINASRMPSANILPLNTIKVRIGLKPATHFQRNRNDLEYGNMLYK